MVHLVASLRSQVRRCLSLSKVAVQLALLCPLLGTFCNPSSAQNTTGLPNVGSAGASVSSLMLIDATQFLVSPVTDMCGAIATACSKLGTTSPNYPLGSTIDARGFTGIQLCKASTITTMLNGCVSGSGHNGGKLLLGNVNVYADGPSGGVNGHYDDGHSSGVGTPAFIIPSGFWGIEGISRGATGINSTTAGLGTFLSVCTGPGTPVTVCTTAFPQRSFGIASTTVSVNTMTIVLSTSPPVGSIYPGELGMVKGSSGALNNGTFKLQSVSGSTLTVTVPSTAGSCSSTCGTLWLGTPILGFGPVGTNAYNTQTCSNTNPCDAFGEHFKTLGFNCQALDGCIGWQNLYAEEESGADTFEITNFSFVGFDSHGDLAQNFGPILDAQISTGHSNANCDFGTTGAYIGDRYMYGFDSWTITSPEDAPNVPSSLCSNMPIAAVMLDAPNTLVSNGHCEAFSNCVLIGANNNPVNVGAGEQVRGIVGPPSNKAGSNVVQISGNYPSSNSFTVQNIRNQGGTTHPNTILDGIKNNTIKDTDAFVGSYAWDTNNSLT
ncbi:MAG TPA: hypothetical protein VN948_10035, partial [Terriglobales bacterium]|nr:hypothetical protein [Terriglobales bacterium]